MRQAFDVAVKWCLGVYFSSMYTKIGMIQMWLGTHTHLILECPIVTEALLRKLPAVVLLGKLPW